MSIQAALKANGYGELGTSGPRGDGVDGDWGPRSIAEMRQFQKNRGLPASGIPDAKTLAALGIEEAASARSGKTVPSAWMPSARMKCIIVHWTAGTNKASANDKSHYHILIEDDGSLVRGTPTIADNDLTRLSKNYAAHTWNYNSGAIGVSLCCMGDGRSHKVKEKPFDAGPYPMTQVQWDKLPYVLADLCRRYGIPVTATTVLSHAEVEPVLGVEQKGKWDITRLAFDTSIIGHEACGDIFRARTAALLKTP